MPFVDYHMTQSKSNIEPTWATWDPGIRNTLISTRLRSCAKPRYGYEVETILPNPGQAMHES